MLNLLLLLEMLKLNIKQEIKQNKFWILFIVVLVSTVCHFEVAEAGVQIQGVSYLVSQI